MKLPCIFKTCPRLVVFLDADKAEFYTTVSLGNISFKSTEAEFGQVINPQNFLKALSDFLKSKKLACFQAQIILNNSLVFQLESKGAITNVPLESNKATLQSIKVSGKEKYFVFNKDFPELASQAVRLSGGKMTAVYARFALADLSKNPKAGNEEICKTLVSNKNAKTLQINSHA